MANLLSELERFEQEMKDLGAEPSSTPAPPAQLVTRVQLASPPLPPPRPAANIVVAASPASPALAVPSSASPSTSASGPSPPPSGFLPSQPVSTGMNGPAGGLLAQPLQPSPRAPPPAPLSSVALTSHSLPPRPPPLPVSNTTSAPLPSSAGQGPSTLSGGQHLPWLATGAGTTASAAVPASGALPTSAPPQFTYTRPVLSYPPPTPAVPPPSSVTPSHSGSYFPVPFHLQQQSHPQQQQQHPQYQQPPQQQQQPQYLQYQPQQYQPPPQQATVIQAQPYTYPVVYPAPIPLPQQQQAQQLFQRDAQTITPEALESVKAALASGDNEHKAEIKKKAVPRKAAGQTWEDPTLADWPENDHRLFCGDLGNEVNDEVLTKAFARFSSFNMARVVRDKRTGKTKGYGFVSFTSPSDLALALKEMNGKYVGNRPIKLRKSTWKDRTDAEAYEKQKNSKKPKTSKKNVLHK